MLLDAAVNSRDTVTISVANLKILREPEPRGLIEPAVGYHYRVQNMDRPRPKGFVDLTFQTASNFAESSEVRGYLERNGVAPNAIVSDLVNFYPHGRKTDGREETLFRKGVGGAVFDVVLSDCKALGASALVVHTTTIEMRRFLGKRGFSPVQEDSAIFGITLYCLDFSANQLTPQTSLTKQMGARPVS